MILVAGEQTDKRDWLLRLMHERKLPVEALRSARTWLSSDWQIMAVPAGFGVIAGIECMDGSATYLQAKQVTIGAGSQHSGSDIRSSAEQHTASFNTGIPNTNKLPCLRAVLVMHKHLQVIARASAPSVQLT